jgi:hypothetical protein
MPPAPDQIIVSSFFQGLANFFNALAQAISNAAH